MKRVGILFHPNLEGAWSLAKELENLLSLQTSVWLSSVLEEESRSRVEGTDLILSLGGDGTILKAAKLVIPWQIPILGVNLGRLGFIAEVSPNEVKDKLSLLLSGEGWLDDRAMLQADFEGFSYHALNDVIVSRGVIAQVVYIKAKIDGEEVTTFKGDGVILATATGSTAYALSVGGPILYPQAKEILLQPISAHLSWSIPMILPPDATIELEVTTEHQAILSVDGQINIPLKNGAKIMVKRSPYITRLLRLEPPSFFFKTLSQRLKRV